MARIRQPWLCLAGVLAALPACIASAQVTFTDVTASAGVDYLQYEIPSPLLINGQEFMTGGAAARDYDGDGWVDLYVTCLDGPDRLLRNRGDGTFEDVSIASGLASYDLATNGAAWGDVDNDGDPDLYVTSHETNRFHLFVNDGSGHFSEEAVARGAGISGPDEHFGYSVSFGDFDRDGFLDIHTDEWRRDDFNPLGALSNARLLRNLGAANPGHFEDVTAAAGVAMDDVPLLFGATGTTTFTSRFTDLDGDLWPDLAVAADFGSSRLFWNNGDGTFTDGTVAAGVGTDENGMGSAVGDYDGDGLLDWFVTSIYDPDELCGCDNGATGNRLYRNLGGRTFEDATDAAGVRDGGWGWGAVFFDYDNDGDLDLSMNNGQDWPFPYIPGADPFMNDPVRLWRNDGGAMTEVASTTGLTASGTGKGMLTFDYDRDGDLDVFFVTNAGHPVLYRNDGGNQNDWLRVELVGTASNRDGIGARVTLMAASGEQVREVSGSSSFLSQSERTVHFGLGQAGASVPAVLVRWPSGRVSIARNVATNTTLVIEEPPPNPWCGLLGIEPCIVLALVRALRGRRRLEV